MKWKNKKLSQKQKIKIILISIYAVIFIIVSKIYLIPIYKKYEAEQLRKRQILAEKEEKVRIESEFKSFGDKFNSLKIVIEKLSFYFNAKLFCLLSLLRQKFTNKQKGRGSSLTRP